MRAADPLRIAVVGAGSMGRGWVRAVARSADAELAGIVDLDGAAAGAAAVDAGAPDLPTAGSLTELASRTELDAVVDVTVPAAHEAVTVEALRLGLDVLGEKPLADSLAAALRLVGASEATGRLFMVSQNYRYNADARAFAALLGRLGSVGLLQATFSKAPHFGGFREQMAHPLLLDMAIHTFDMARMLLAADPISCYCDAFNPPWSWYAGDAAATATFEMAGGARFGYTGSWCSAGDETPWNSRWRASGAHGSAAWDGGSTPTVALADPGSGATVSPAPDPPAATGIDGSLAEFVGAVRTGATPTGECHDNVYSLAMVHAALESDRTSSRTVIADLFEQAYATAVQESDGDVRATLQGWPSPAPRRR